MRFVCSLRISFESPLAEGRELKSDSREWYFSPILSPLAERRELKLLVAVQRKRIDRRPSRRGVN